MTPTATVAIHISETTTAQWGTLGGGHGAWDPWHIYGFLMEQLRSDGTPFDVVTDAAIDADALMDGAFPRYAILFSLWDTLFGTLFWPLDRNPAQIGYPGMSEMPRHFGGQMAWPLVRAQK